MKIVCDSCGAKYSIADEKVAGKIFKIRCKKCSSVLEVRGDQTGALKTLEDSEAFCREANNAIGVAWLLHCRGVIIRDDGQGRWQIHYEDSPDDWDELVTERRIRARH